MIEIVRHLRDNRRRVYPPPPAGPLALARAGVPRVMGLVHLCDEGLRRAVAEAHRVLVGQYLVKAYFRRMRGQAWWRPTSRRRRPSGTSTSSRPIHTDGARRRVAGAVGGWTVPSPHLWAVAWK